MKLLIILLVCVASSFAEIWEFGTDNGGGTLRLQYEGGISFFEKHKTIKLEVPDCYAIFYVKVKINNRVSSPTVDYNELTNEVKIAYTPLEISMSSYEIEAKAERELGCEGPPLIHESATDSEWHK